MPLSKKAWHTKEQPSVSNPFKYIKYLLCTHLILQSQSAILLIYNPLTANLIIFPLRQPISSPHRAHIQDMFATIH